EVLFDSLSLANFNRDELKLSLELIFDADFMDVFQVRGTVRTVHGQYYRPVWHGHRLSFFYQGLDGVSRQTRIEINPAPTRSEEKSAVWEIKLAPMKECEIQVMIIPVVGEPKQIGPGRDFEGCLRERRHRFAKWEHVSTQVSTNNTTFDTALNTAIG